MQQLISLCLILLGCVMSTAPVSQPVETSTVTIENMKFEPPIIKVKRGTVVLWYNLEANPHNVVGDGFRSPYLFENQKWTYRFEQVGTFEYFCEPHKAMGMTGKVIVE